MDSDTELLIGRNESHAVGITSFQEAQLFELRRTNQELAKINERAMKKRKKELVFKAIGIVILVAYMILQILHLFLHPIITQKFLSILGERNVVTEL